MLDEATRARLETFSRYNEEIGPDVADLLAAYDAQAPIVAAAVAYVAYGLGHPLLVGCGGGMSYWETLKAAVAAASAVGEKQADAG